ncbi:MAG TPA: 4Fe-4S dicluster domain-containing protein [Candidatus Sulfomarinibacteraceae bacterium]|nr:4Fe-4S dicluster domain-containing protein [Candidatus Sulfomarinibacteraceae bacterium]
MDEREMNNTQSNSSDVQEKRTLRRREFLKLSLAGLAVTAGPAVAWRSVRPSAAPRGDSKHSWAMVIDQQKCVGCGHCTLACRARNDVPPTMSWNRIVEDEQKETFLSIPCMHCEDAPCVHVCPVNATYQRADGIVMMDYDRCIGCRYCEMACPYASRVFNWTEFSGDNPAVPSWGQPDVPRRPRGVVEKCTFCVERIDRGLENGLTPGVDKAATPACVVACPTGARLFGDLNDPESPVSKALARYSSFRLRENLGTGPRVYYLPPRDKEEQPELQEVCT